ncbi:MAG: glycosyltransferase family 1 protein [Candidatus Sericytochromatia bacterium]|nr:glycosyltransferase family 1 protein [Candidatus Sericytochromatia bacterium]
MTRIALLAHGTRGDVQPYVALAARLMEAGFDVSLAAPPNLEAFVRRCEIPYKRLSGDSQVILESEQGRRWLSSGNVAAFLKELGDILHDLRHDLDREVQVACEGADAIIAQPLTEDRGLIMAEALGVPLLLGNFFPYCRTGAFANPFVTTSKLPLPMLNRATYALFDHIWWKGQRPVMNQMRAQLGLAPESRSTKRRIYDRRDPFLHAFSTHVLPRPTDWGDEHTVTGYWQLPQALREKLGEAAMPAKLVDWLAAGPAPIFIGFGSMPVEDPAAILASTIDLARRLQTRIIIGAGWSNLADTDLPDEVCLIGSVNHEWLFPQCRAVVHHGGAGTTAASLRAGAPTLICSVFADQPFWGRRVADLGVGAHIPFRKMSPTGLESALRDLLRPEVAQRASALSKRLQQENGIDEAVMAIKTHLNDKR